MSLFKDCFPPPDAFLVLEPEEAALYVLEVLCRSEDDEFNRRVLLNRRNVTNSRRFTDYCDEAFSEKVALAISEAWVWLVREGLLAPLPDEGPDWVFVTRRGRKIRDQKDAKNLKNALLLQPDLLDPGLCALVRADFMRGDFETAVFKAMREVEIRTRAYGKLAEGDIGVKLMRKAFDPKTGPLHDPEQEDGEKESLSHLFAGGLGTFKNPVSHRSVDYSEPKEALEIVHFADLLLRILERRKPT